LWVLPPFLGGGWNGVATGYLHSLVEITTTIEAHAITKATTIEVGITIEAHVKAKAIVIVELATTAKAQVVQ
jgi:hypothetical protein